jgi:sorting nexin-1/2
MLGKVWDIADRSAKGHLTRIEFFVALRSIALAQSRQTISREMVAQCDGLIVNQLPRFGNDYPLPTQEEIDMRHTNRNSLANATFSLGAINPQFNAKVQPPIKHESGFAEHMVYSIDVHCTTGVLNSTESVSHRRYSDFEWLRLRLLEDSMGRVVPPLPPKKYFGRFEKEFLDERRTGLEDFLNRLTSDPIFMNSRPLITFFQPACRRRSFFPQADEESFAKARGTGPTLITQVIALLQSSLANFMPHNVKHNLPTDARLEDFTNQLKELKDRLKTAQRKHYQYLPVFTARVTMALEFVTLSVPPTLPISQDEVREITEGLRREFETMRDTQKKEFHDILGSIILQIRAVEEVVKQRKGAQSQYDELLKKGESKRQRQALLRGDHLKQHLVDDLEKEIASISKESDAARHRYDTISRELESEILQFDTMRKRNTVKALRSLVELEAKFAKVSVRFWTVLHNRLVEAQASKLPVVVDLPKSVLGDAVIRNVSPAELKHVSVPPSAFQLGAQAPSTIPRLPTEPAAPIQRPVVSSSFGRSRDDTAHETSGVVVTRSDLPAYAQALASTEEYHEIRGHHTHSLDDDDYFLPSRPNGNVQVPSHWK